MGDIIVNARQTKTLKLYLQDRRLWSLPLPMIRLSFSVSSAAVKPSVNKMAPVQISMNVWYMYVWYESVYVCMYVWSSLCKLLLHRYLMKLGLCFDSTIFLLYTNYVQAAITFECQLWRKLASTSSLNLASFFPFRFPFIFDNMYNKFWKIN